MSSYSALLNQLYSINLHNGMKLGLANTLALSRALGAPEKQFSTVHIAGTNGKGSVATKMAKGLQLSGKKVGLYTSPHISSFRERIKINGEMIDESSFVKHLERLFAIDIKATFFEYATFLAFLYFAEQKVDYAVIETGLGGRLDATNVIMPTLSVITSISYDHTEFLGTSLEQIAYEKAGIIKHYSPLVIGPKADFDIIKTFARVQESPLYQVTGIYKTYDEENSAIAKKGLQVLGLSEEVIEKGIAVRPPCRVEKIGNVILDVAHNTDGLTELFRVIGDQKLPIVFGLSKTKDIAGCLAIIKEHGSHFYPVEAPNGRGLPVDQLKDMMYRSGFKEEEISVLPSIEEAVRMARMSGEQILVCGTFFIMAPVRQALGIVEPRDPYDTNEKGR